MTPIAFLMNPAGPDLLVLLFIVALVGLPFYARNRTVPLVIKTWRASDSPDSAGHYIVILGRREGIISWLLALLRVDATTSITVSAVRIEFEEASLSGRTKRLIPLSSVCSTIYGYTKPWKKALLILVLVSMAVIFGSVAVTHDSPGIGSVLLGLLVGFGLAFLYYFLNRQFTLGFVEDSGVLSAIQFKRSVVENQDINEVQASYVSQVTQALIENSRNKP